MRTFSFYILLSLILATRIQAAELTNIAAFLTLVQKAWDANNSYQVKFKQVVLGKRLGSREEASGTMSVVKPGRLRWESSSDGNTEILNGNKFINIHENRRRKSRTVDIYKDVSKQMDAGTLNFLAGKIKFKEWYRSEIVTETAEKIEVKLVPRSGVGDSYVAEFDKASYLLRALTTENSENKVRIDFLETHTNVELEDKLFEYKPNPKDVVTNQ